MNEVIEMIKMIHAEGPIPLGSLRKGDLPGHEFHGNQWKTFTSNGPGPFQSRGTVYKVGPDPKHEPVLLSTGVASQKFLVVHNDEVIGHVRSHSSYKDKKDPGSRIVASRKDVVRWEATVYKGHHAERNDYNERIQQGNATSLERTSKADALQRVADMHSGVGAPGHKK